MLDDIRRKWILQLRGAAATGLVLAAAVLAAGCSSIGPGTVTRDRLDYTTAVAESWQRQMLLNLVKLRYGDTPMFLEVGQIVAGYQVQSTFSVAGTSNNLQNNTIGGINSSIGLGAQGQFIDRPTVTYAPLSGEQFARQLLTPIPPASILSLAQGGTPIDLVFRLTVQEINGIRNQPSGDLQTHPADPEFYELLARLRRVQSAGALSLRVMRQDKGGTTLITLRQQGGTPDESDSIAIRKLLGLDTGAGEFAVVYGSLAANDKEIAILSRSILQVLSAVARSITVPEPHVVQHRTSANTGMEMGPTGPIAPLVQVHSSSEPPKDAAVAVPYRGYWFWIDDRDLLSKRVFSFLLFAFAMVDTGSKGPAPVLTIPAQ